MNAEIIERLSNTGVFRDGEDGTALELSRSFLETQRDIKSRLEAVDGDSSALNQELSDDDRSRDLVELADHDIELLTMLRAAERIGDEFDDDDLSRVVSVLSYFRYPEPRTEGVPETFVPLHGRQLPHLLRIHPRAIVFVWRDNCDPCETVREDLEEIVAEPPTDIGCFAVYGPECAEFLEDRYEVAAGPTTLFFVDGTVDSRLLGPTPKSVIEQEVEMLKQT